MADHSSISRQEIATEARSWIGTPYKHQASVKGVGCDCLGLIRGVWRHLYGSEAEEVPAYTSDWGQVTGEETMLDAAARHLILVDPIGDITDAEMAVGNVIVFRMHRRAVAKHAGIIVGYNRFVHAYQPMKVTENWLDPWWYRRIAAIFEFPGVK